MFQLSETFKILYKNKTSNCSFFLFYIFNNFPVYRFGLISNLSGIFVYLIRFRSASIEKFQILKACLFNNIYILLNNVII